jgi:triacylglycerol lipase
VNLKLFLPLLGLVSMVATARAEPPAETVVLLHGLGRTSLSMARIAHDLEREGYRVVNLCYPSRTKSLEEIATHWLPAQLARAGLPTAETSARTRPGGLDAVTSPRVHFVTHSMGGIIVRLWLRETGASINVGRVVMLAPPNAGSEITDRFNWFAPYRWATGLNGRRLGTKPDDLPRALGPWPPAAGELGIIAGDRPLNPWLAAALPLANDGKVTVAATHLAGERGHVVLHHSHTWIAWHADTLAQVKSFLRDGKFL